MALRLRSRVTKYAESATPQTNRGNLKCRPERESGESCRVTPNGVDAIKPRVANSTDKPVRAKYSRRVGYPGANYHRLSCAGSRRPFFQSTTTGKKGPPARLRDTPQPDEFALEWLKVE